MSAAMTFVPRPKSLASACGDGDYVFHRAGELHTENVVIGIETQRRTGELRLQVVGERFNRRSTRGMSRLSRFMISGDHHHSGIAARSFQCETRPGKDGEERCGCMRGTRGLGHNFAHAQMRRRFEAFRGAHQNGRGSKMRQRFRVDGARVRRGNRANDDVGILQRSREIGRNRHLIRNVAARQIRRVLPRLRDFFRERRVANPHRNFVRVVAARQNYS